MAAPILNKHSHRPLYLQLVDHLVGEVKAGHLRVGEQVPSERELAEDLGVSRTTARLAVEELVKTGVVYREQGKGTFVAEPPLRGLQGFTSFSEDVLSRNGKPGSRVLRFGIIEAAPRIRERLRLAHGDPVLELVRIRTVDDVPVALQESHLPAHLAPGLEQIDMTDQSLFALLRSRYFVYPAWTEAEVEASFPSESETQLLGLGKADPVLTVHGVTFTDSFEVVEAVRTVYPGQGFRLYMGRQRFDQTPFENPSA